MTVTGGYTSYGQLAGVLMLGSKIPRIPGDLGHALSFDFPVRYEAAPEFPFSDLISGAVGNIDKVLNAVQKLEREGVRFVAADCGLFSVLQTEISRTLTIPFLSSALMLIPFLKIIRPGKKIGVLTGDSRLLQEHHLRPIGATLQDIVFEGLEDSAEFTRVVINQEDSLDPAKICCDLIEAGRRLKNKNPEVEAVILECTNFISFKKDLQRSLGLPIYDMLSLVDLVADGYLYKSFTPRFL